ncbi:MAG TPA: tyrosine--tRNA ligase [Acidimicrobiales bacterium]|nr:tyrosine--tRNA ligase [Acidimicrobiales bacterium]
MGDLFEDLEWRGLVHQVTDPAVAGLVDQGGLTVYIGFDPTADSLHLGSLLPILALRRMQLGGHRPIALAGGGTGMIGDPSGRESERPLLTDEEVEANVAGIASQLERFLDFEAGPRQAIVANNRQWLGALGLIEFLRDVGKHFTVNQMIAKESVRVRLGEREQGISFTEFSYMLLQAYDFLHLSDSYGCRLQMGGSDQWGNITMGIDLVRRLRGNEVYGLTSPLLLKPDGTKYGKSETGTVWLDGTRTSPYALFQFLLRSDDSMVPALLRWYTFLPRSRIEELDELTRTRPERREAQRVLAREVVSLVHGEQEATRAERAAGVLFSEEISTLDEATLLEVFADAPSSARPRSDLEPPGLAVVEALRDSGLVSSLSAARTTVSQGGAYVNNRRVGDPDQRLGVDDLISGRYAVLRRGKKDHHLLRFE